MIPLSVLDQTPIPEGVTPAQALERLRDLRGVRRDDRAQRHRAAVTQQQAAASSSLVVFEGKKLVSTEQKQGLCEI